MLNSRSKLPRADPSSPNVTRASAGSTTVLSAVRREPPCPTSTACMPASKPVPLTRNVTSPPAPAWAGWTLPIVPPPTMRKNQSLPSWASGVYWRWKAVGVTARSRDPVAPAMNALPPPSIAIALGLSSPLPPMKVEYFRAPVAASSWVTPASYVPPPCRACRASALSGKFGPPALTP